MLDVRVVLDAVPDYLFKACGAETQDERDTVSACVRTYARDCITATLLTIEDGPIFKDAWRYRWVRQHWGRIVDTYHGDSGRIESLTIAPAGSAEGWDVDAESLDAAIDAAMEKADGASVATMSDSKHTIYERMFHSAVAALAEISDALGIPEDVASTANGNAEILHAIRALLKERDALAAKVASYERADRDGLEAVRTTDATLNAGLDKLRAIANGQVVKISPLQASLVLDYVRASADIGVSDLNEGPDSDEPDDDGPCPDRRCTGF